MPQLARRLFPQDFAMGTPGQALIVTNDGQVDWGSPTGTGTPNGWLDVKASYGAKGDGVTNDTTAIQNAINAANTAGGGTVYFPPGTYVTASGLSLDQMTGIRLYGAGPAMQYQSGVTKILFTGSSGHLLSMHSSTNCELANLDFEYNNASYTGDLIDIDGAPFAADCQNNHIHHCGSKTLTGQNARSIVRFNKAVINQIDHCHWTGGSYNLRIGDAGGSYVNILTIASCTFNFAANAMIWIGTADGETICIRDCTFEAGTNTTGIYGSQNVPDGGQNQLYSPIIEGNWFGDSSSATKWIDGLVVTSDSYAGIIRNNRFSGTSSGTHLNNMRGTWVVMGNSFEGGTVYGAQAAGHNILAIAIGNYYNNVTTLYNFTPYGRMNLGDLGGAAASNALGTQAQLGPNLGNSITDDGTASLNLGVKVNSGVQAFTAGNASALILNTADGYVGLQGPEVDLIGGTTRQLKVNSTGLGFNGTAPIAKPTVTGSKSANAALTSLMTALANLGLVTDSTT